MMTAPEIIFPGLGIEIDHLDPVMFRLFGFSIAWYGFFIYIAFTVGLIVAEKYATKTNQNKNIYMDYLFYSLIPIILGARLYYYVFTRPELRPSFFNIRGGGLAVYGGIIAAVLCAWIFCKIKHVNFLIFADTAMPSISLGQAIGRIGNFFNREAYGGPSKGFLRMLYRIDTVFVEEKAKNSIVQLHDALYISVHPTFLYEMILNLCIFFILLRVRKNKKFNGQIFCLYFILYGLGRSMIEMLRTDQLLFFGLPVSVMLSVILAVGFFVEYCRLNASEKPIKDG